MVARPIHKFKHPVTGYEINCVPQSCPDCGYHLLKIRCPGKCTASNKWKSSEELKVEIKEW